jgi:hypothetical protein
MSQDLPLTLRATVTAGQRCDDDLEVHWNGLLVGRILKSHGIPAGLPDWSWSMAFPGQPQEPWQRGMCSDLEDAKQRFKVAWFLVQRRLSEGDMEDAHRIFANPHANPSSRIRVRERGF